GHLDNRETRVDTDSSEPKGIIALGQLTLNTVGLNNQQGYLISQQNQTLNIGSLNNVKGIISGLSAQTLHVLQNITNKAGRISAYNSRISAHILDNQAGILSAADRLAVTVADTLTNRESGKLNSNGEMTISAKHLDNAQGDIRSTHSNLSITSLGGIHNVKGHIGAERALTVRGGGIDNTAGQFYANQSGLVLDAGRNAIHNRDGEVISHHTLTLNSRELNNQNGLVYSQTHSQLDVAQHIDNTRNGDMTSIGGLTIKTTQLDNRQGVIQAGRELNITARNELNNQRIDNTGSRIESMDALTLSAYRVNNQDTATGGQNTSQGIIGKRLTFNVDKVNNQQGLIHSNTIAYLNLAQDLNNQQGRITSFGRADLLGRDLVINNQNGYLGANQQFTVNSHYLSSDGHIEADNVDLQLQSDFNSQNNIHARLNLTLNTTGNIVNQHQLYADNRVTLNAQHITNEGEISGAATQITAQQSLTNRGLINSIAGDGQSHTVVKANQLLNVAGGRIYGDYISLQADLLQNHGDEENKIVPVIAARAGLDIGVRQLENNSPYLGLNAQGSLIYSEGYLHLGRQLDSQNKAYGNADTLFNNASTLESLGNMRLNADRIFNENPHFKAHHVVSGQAPDEITYVDQTKVNETYIIAKGKESAPLDYIKNDLGDEKGLTSRGEWLDTRDMHWGSFSRAGQWEYKSIQHLPMVEIKKDTVITDKMALADPYEFDCNGNDACTPIAAGMYQKDSAIWAYLNIKNTLTSDPPTFPMLDQSWFTQVQDKADPSDTVDVLVIPSEPTEPQQPVRGRASEAEFNAQMQQYQRDYAQYLKAKARREYYENVVVPYEKWLNDNEQVLDDLKKGIHQHNSKLSRKEDRDFFRRYWELTINNRREDESKVIDSQPGQILAGQDLTFNSQAFFNNSSFVIAGDTLALKDQVINNDQEGLHRITETGSKKYSYSKWRGGFKRYHQRRNEAQGPYKRELETPFYMGITRLEDVSTIPSQVESDHRNPTGHLLNTQRVNEAMLSLPKTHTEMDLGQVGLTDRANTQALGYHPPYSPDLKSPLNKYVKRIKNQKQEAALSAPQHSPLTVGLGLQTFEGSMKETATELKDSPAGRHQSALSAPEMRNMLRVTVDKTGSTEIRTIDPNTHLPVSAFYKINPDVNTAALVETDPQFASRRDWLSSDYMFNALSADPNLAQKRLGDAAYEHKLIREQINRLTGRQFLGHFRDFDQQYKALMNAGITFAKQFNLRPGIRLSEAQVALLTSDIVWLENRQVRLPNGEYQTVRVPRVYTVSKKGDVTGNGSFLGGQNTTHSGGELHNRGGTIFGADTLTLDSHYVENRGKLSGNILKGNIKGDMDNIGGMIEADKAILLDITGNLTHKSTSHTSKVRLDGYSREETNIGRAATFLVKDSDGILSVVAHNITSTGARFINQGRGDTLVRAREKLIFDNLEVGFKEQLGSGNHVRKETLETEAVNIVRGNGNVTVKGKDAAVYGGEFSAKSALELLAENDLVLGTAKTKSTLEESHYSTSGSGFSSKTHTSWDKSRHKVHHGVELEGGSILVSAGNYLSGQSVITVSKEADAVFYGGKGINITSAVNEHFRENRETTTRKGVLTGKGKLGITFGKRTEEQYGQEEVHSESDARGMMGAEKGDIRFISKGEVNVHNVDFITDPKKKVRVEGTKLSITSGKDVLVSSEGYAIEESGLTLSFSSPVTDAVQSGYEAMQQAKRAKNPKLAGLFKLKAAQEAIKAAQNAGKVAKTLGSMGDKLERNGEAAANPAVKVSLGIGGQSQSFHSDTKQVRHHKNTISSGTVELVATEDKVYFEGDMDADKLHLSAPKGIEIKGVKDSHDNQTKEKSAGGNVGVFVGFNGNSYGIGLEAGVNVGRGKSNSSSNTYQNSVINVNKLETFSEEGALVL
ncbi:heme utilization protein, partial [Muribacter muris]